MSIKPYPKYKDSGVEWLGMVPEGWAVVSCRGIVCERTAKNEGAKCQDYLSLMANVGIIPYAEKGDVGNKKPEDLTKCKVVTRGDFVINSMNYGIGSYGLSDYDGVCSPVYIVLKPQNDVIESRFAFRIFENRAFQTLAQSFGNGILEHRCAINWDILKSIGVGVPPMDEQRTILAFLDHETAKIDALIAEQEKLIELLKEKRSAVISHAVTKGLNPDVKMKDSGVEWLGMVPEGWDVTKFRFLFRESSEKIEQEIIGPMLSVSGYRGIEVKEYDDENKRRLEEDLIGYRIVRVGQLVVNTMWLNYAGLGVSDFEGHVSPAYRSYSISPDLNRRFCHHLLRSEIYVKGYTRLLTGVRPNSLQMSREDLMSFPVIVPKLEEQSAIASFLDNETSKIDALTTEAQHGIDLLQERRSALISAAVTGQIDVRDH